MLNPAVFRADLKGITADVPAQAVWIPMDGQGAPMVFAEVSYNPGDQTEDPVTGGIIAGQGSPTIVIDGARFLGRVPEENDLFTINYGGQEFRTRIASVSRGLVAWTIALTTPER